MLTVDAIFNWSAFKVDFIGDCIKLIETMYSNSVNIFNIGRTAFFERDKSNILVEPVTLWWRQILKAFPQRQAIFGKFYADVKFMTRIKEYGCYCESRNLFQPRACCPVNRQTDLC